MVNLSNSMARNTLAVRESQENRYLKEEEDCLEDRKTQNPDQTIITSYNTVMVSKRLLSGPDRSCIYAPIRRTSGVF